MRIIPVIDVMNGMVVHAKGDRQSYRPIKSVITTSTEPYKVAEAFSDFPELYIADIDRIMKKGDNFNTIFDIESIGFEKVFFDFGISDLGELYDVKLPKSFVPVLSTESFLSFEKMHSKKYVFSLDFRGDKLLTAIPTVSLNDILKYRKNINEIILLDLSLVGKLSGPNLHLTEKIIKLFKLPVIVGCGIRGYDDIVRVKNAGASGVLISSAFHLGKISTKVVI